MSGIRSLMPKDVSPHSILTHLQEHLPELAELYVIVKTKDGDSWECVSGDMEGLAYAVLRLQSFALATMYELG